MPIARGRRRQVFLPSRCFRSNSLRWLSLALLLTSCSGRAARLRPPDIDPQSAAAEAISLYDVSGDGNLSGAELLACPGINSSFDLYDTDANGMISAEEIAARLRSLTQFKTALTSLRVRVRLNGQPLGGADVKFVPEKYLGNEVKPAYGTTNRSGSASVSVAEEDLPKSQRGYRGVHYGTYKVVITHPDRAIPAKYNAETTLGYETAVGNPIAVFELSSS